MPASIGGGRRLLSMNIYCKPVVVLVYCTLARAVKNYELLKVTIMQKIVTPAETKKTLRNEYEISLHAKVICPQ